MMREGKEAVDLSEMYAVYKIYLDKAERYIRLRGKANFSEGSLGHDVINVMDQYGVVPESAYRGMRQEDGSLDHTQLVKEMEKLMKKLLKLQKKGDLPEMWRDQVADLLITHLDLPPEEFYHEGKMYSSREFADEVVGLDPEDYVSFTSFSHRPMYKSFVLEVPDNYSQGAFYNVHIDELKEIAMNALQKGYTIEWDCDVSNGGFSARRGIAIVPDRDMMMAEGIEDQWSAPGPEVQVTQEMRQEAFDSFVLTDDHLMHIVGLAKDQENNLYYVVKNSWGSIGEKEGYVYVSEAYFKMNTISILLHKDAVPAHLAEKIDW